ncbi:MAG: anti-sigma factor antagonist [Clostridia bacterium]|nr:anti-sigma factor antagonist [Clostridia bacterium]MBQ4130719.1 anti-sigma factor antagonist [Clostridia bacterium]MBQ7107542.1 anti-sigma factor antagonist [Clostridia bacterium]MBQ9919463.1 anti-sigma factor antagonist [Clostridia bacterium]
MSVSIVAKGEVITAFLNGEIDHHTAAELRTTIDDAVVNNKPTLLVLDFKNVSFMDSSGIGLVMGRYKTISELGGELAIVNTSPGIGKVMKLAGMERLAKIGMEELVNETNQ